MKLKLHNVFFDCLHQIDIEADCDARNCFVLPVFGFSRFLLRWTFAWVIGRVDCYLVDDLGERLS
jgi:hypothetical protein